MKKIFISTLCVAMMLVLSACESPEQRSATGTGVHSANDTTRAKYAKVLTHYDDHPSLISGEISEYTRYTNGVVDIVFKEPFIIYIDGKPITTNAVITHANNVYIFYND